MREAHARVGWCQEPRKCSPREALGARGSPLCSLLTPESVSSSGLQPLPPSPSLLFPPPRLSMAPRSSHRGHRKDRCTHPSSPCLFLARRRWSSETDVLLIGPEHCLDEADLPKWTLAAISPKLLDDSWHVHPLPWAGRAEDRSGERASRPAPNLQPRV